MSIVISFCFCYPLGSGVISSVYHVPYQPRAFGIWHKEPAKVPSFCSWSGKERPKSSACLCWRGGEARDPTLFLSAMALMQSRRHVHWTENAGTSKRSVCRRVESINPVHLCSSLVQTDDWRRGPPDSEMNAFVSAEGHFQYSVVMDRCCCWQGGKPILFI